LHLNAKNTPSLYTAERQSSSGEVDEYKQTAECARYPVQSKAPLPELR
jgi:hypothetical protein